MEVIDFILNLAGLLLWFAWRSAGFDPLLPNRAASLASALQRASKAPVARWPLLSGLIAMLLGRAWFYSQIGTAVDWVPHLSLGAISVYFKSDSLARMFLFSGLSFGVFLAVFYGWLLFLSLLNAGQMQTDPIQKLISSHLGAVDRWSRPVKAALPFFFAAGVWLALNPLLVQCKLVQAPLSGPHRLEEAGVIALAAYLSWKYLLGALLLFGLLASYVYMGEHPAWTFVHGTCRNLFAPFHWLPLRIGKLDLAPVLAIVLIFLGATPAERGLTALYKRLPLKWSYAGNKVRASLETNSSAAILGSLTVTKVPLSGLV